MHMFGYSRLGYSRLGSRFGYSRLMSLEYRECAPPLSPRRSPEAEDYEYNDIWFSHFFKGTDGSDITEISDTQNVQVMWIM